MMPLPSGDSSTSFPPSSGCPACQFGSSNSHPSPGSYVGIALSCQSVQPWSDVEGLVVSWCSESCLSTSSHLKGGSRRGAYLTGVPEPVSMVCSNKWVLPKLPSPTASRSLYSSSRPIKDRIPPESPERSARKPLFPYRWFRGRHFHSSILFCGVFCGGFLQLKQIYWSIRSVWSKR